MAHRGEPHDFPPVAKGGGVHGRRYATPPLRKGGEGRQPRRRFPVPPAPIVWAGLLALGAVIVAVTGCDHPSPHGLLVATTRRSRNAFASKPSFKSGWHRQGSIWATNQFRLKWPSSHPATISGEWHGGAGHRMFCLVVARRRSNAFHKKSGCFPSTAQTRFVGVSPGTRALVRRNCTILRRTSSRWRGPRSSSR